MEKQVTKFAFDKTTSYVLKGIFLLLMFILHFFCFPGYYIESKVSPEILFMEQFQGNFQICVAGFAFLTGFLYNYTKKKDFRYTVKKWIDIIIPYWFVFLIIFIIAVALGIYIFDIKDFVLEFFAIDRDIMCFCWYVPFYFLFILFLQVLTSCFKKKFSNIFIIGFGFFIPIAIYYISLIVINNGLITPILEKFQVFAPIGVVGYVVSNLELFQKVEKKINNKGVLAALSIILIAIVFSQPSWLYLVDGGIIVKMLQKVIRAFSIPFFIFGLVQIIKLVPKSVNKPFAYVGRYSMYMWFIHCAFFNILKYDIQPIVFFSDSAIVNILLGMIISFVLSVMIDYPIKKILKSIHKSI